MEKPQLRIDEESHWLKNIGKYHFGFKHHQEVYYIESLIMAIDYFGKWHEAFRKIYNGVTLRVLWLRLIKNISGYNTLRIDDFVFYLSRNRKSYFLFLSFIFNILFITCHCVSFNSIEYLIILFVRFYLK